MVGAVMKKRIVIEGHKGQSIAEEYGFRGHTSWLYMHEIGYGDVLEESMFEIFGIFAASYERDNRFRVYVLVLPLCRETGLV